MIYPDLDRSMIGYDTECTGLRWYEDRMFAASVSLPDGKSIYVDIRKDEGGYRWLKDQIPRAKKIVAHNSKFDWHMSREAGIIFPEDRVECTMVRAALIDEHRLAYDLDSVAMDSIGLGKATDVYEKLASLFGGKPTKQAQIQNLHRAPASLVEKYAIQDSAILLPLYNWQQNEIKKQELEKVLALENELTPCIVDFECRGVRVDVAAAEKAVKELIMICEREQKELNELAGFKINPNPSNSIHQLFEPKLVSGKWVLIDGTPVESTPAGKASIGSDTLRRMKHPAAEKILRLRKYIKTVDTFLKGHILGHHHNGVIHANFNQTKSDTGDGSLGTGTGRMSINDPALQQIHKRDAEIAAIVRSIFVPDEGHDWACNDWAQMDFRVFAHYVNNPVINKMYADDPGSDFHAMTAELTGLPRKPRFAGDANAKQVNLGLIFGMGQGRLAQEMGLLYTVSERKGKTFLMPGPEAEAVFRKYHEAIPGVGNLLSSASSVARERGFVRTIMGRRIRFPNGQFTHKAGGLVFQGTAADALKVKMVELHRYFKQTSNGRLMLNVHDEFDSSVRPGDEQTRKEVSNILTTFDGINCPIKFRIPICTDQGVGANWWQASKE